MLHLGPGNPGVCKGTELSAAVLLRLARVSFRHPVKVVVVSVLLALMGVILALFRLEINVDRAALVDSEGRLERLSRNYQREFPNSDEMVVVVEGGSRRDRERYVSLLERRLSRRPDLFQNTLTAVNTDFLRRRALTFLTSSELADLEKKLSLAAGANQPGEIKKLPSHAIPLLNDALNQLLVSLQSRGSSKLNFPWSMDRSAFAGPNYLSAGEGRILVLLTRPSRPELLASSRQALEQEMQEVRPAVPTVSAILTGEKILELDETESSFHDSSRATIWSLLLVGALFALGFGNLARPAQAVLVVVLAGCWTLGVTTLIIGHLNLLTVTFATILAGIGIDFGIHLAYRYDEDRARGLEPLQAMESTLRTAGTENLAGAWATSLSFAAICFTGFKGVAEVGAITAWGVLFSFLGAVLVLPALFFIQERGKKSSLKRATGWVFLRKAERFYLSRLLAVLLPALLLTAVSLPQFFTVSFDGNLLSLQDPSLPSVRGELSLARAGDQGVMYAVSVAAAPQQARLRKKKFEALPLVSRVETVADLMTQSDPQKSRRIETIAGAASRFTLPGDKKELSSDDLRTLEPMFLNLEKLSQGQGPEHLELRRILLRLSDQLENLGHGPLHDGLQSFQTQAVTDLREVILFLREQTGQPLTSHDLPPELALRGVGKSGAIALRIYPRENCWERASAERFVAALRTGDPNVVGTPVLIHHHAEAMRRAFQVSGYYAMAAVVVLLWLHFRRVKETFLALVPKLLSIIWMVGIMGWMDVRFNPANFIALPLILGVGVIFGVHVIHRALEDGSPHIFRHSTGPAIALSGLTTMAGFGTLAYAGHQGIASLGVVMVAGVGTGLVASLVVLPALLAVLEKRT